MENHDNILEDHRYEQPPLAAGPPFLLVEHVDKPKPSPCIPVVPQFLSLVASYLAILKQTRDTKQGGKQRKQEASKTKQTRHKQRGKANKNISFLLLYDYS